MKYTLFRVLTVFSFLYSSRTLLKTRSLFLEVPQELTFVKGILVSIFPLYRLRRATLKKKKKKKKHCSSLCSYLMSDSVSNVFSAYKKAQQETSSTQDKTTHSATDVSCYICESSPEESCKGRISLPGEMGEDAKVTLHMVHQPAHGSVQIVYME